MLAVIATPATGVIGAFELRTYRSLALVLRDPAGERLRLSDGMSGICLRMSEGTLLDGPVTLRFLVDDNAASSQLRTLARFRALREHGLCRVWRHRPEPRARRWILQLRALDALGAGADAREIASALFGGGRTEAEWRDRDGSLRSAVRRLIANARSNAAGGYRDLLGGEAITKGDS